MCVIWDMFEAFHLMSVDSSVYHVELTWSVKINICIYNYVYKVSMQPIGIIPEWTVLFGV